MKHIYCDMDGTLCRFHDAEHNYIEAMWQQGFYENLQPFENMVDALNQLYEQGFDIHILSAYLDTEPPFIQTEKKAWIHKYLPFIKDENIHLVPAGADKSQYINNELDADCILVDDYNKNLAEWQNAGGSAVKFVNNVNDKGKGAYGGEVGNLWTGNKVYHSSEPNSISSILSKSQDVVGTIVYSESNERVEYTSKEELLKDFQDAFDCRGPLAVNIEYDSADDELSYKIDDLIYGEAGYDIGSFEQWKKDKADGVNPIDRIESEIEALQQEQNDDMSPITKKLIESNKDISLSNEKYQLTDNIKTLADGTVVYQIMANKEFADVSIGDLGGYVENTDNLSSRGNCWIYDNAVACENALVVDNAIVKNDAVVKGDCGLFDNCEVGGTALVSGCACVKDFAQIRGESLVSDYSLITDSAVIDGHACIVDGAQVHNNAHITDNAMVKGRACVIDSVTVKGDCQLSETRAYYGSKTISDTPKRNNRISIRDRLTNGNSSHKQRDTHDRGDR